jgi:hypothetical protein
MERVKQKPDKYIQVVSTQEVYRRISSDERRGIFVYVNDKQNKQAIVKRFPVQNGYQFCLADAANVPHEIVTIPRHKYVQYNRGYLPNKFGEQKPYHSLLKTA